MIRTLLYMLQGRSSSWAKVRRQYLALNGYCAACGTVKRLEAHHIEPFHNDPAKELDRGT
jgi:5-methylcytosine-specific restriction endonuclease McrA